MAAGEQSSSQRLPVIIATALIVVGVVCMVAPALIRDGICGIFTCADRVPEIAIGRGAEDSLVVLVPETDAGSVRAVRLLEGSSGGGTQRWRIQNGGSAGDLDSFVVGAQPEGYETTTVLEATPAEGTWTAEVDFQCTISSLPFSPNALTVGQFDVGSGGSTTEEGYRSQSAPGEQCASEPTTVERVLFFLGMALASLGAVLGVIVVLRRPVRPEDALWEPDDDGWEQ